MSNDDNTRPNNDVILRTASIDDNMIKEFNSDGSEGVSITQSVISESCKFVFSKWNKINLSVNSCGNDNGSLPISSVLPLIIIDIPKLSPTSTPEEEVNYPTTSNDVYEHNLTVGNETNINNNVLEFVLQQISLLKVMSSDFIEFDNVMKSSETKNISLCKFGDINDNYIELIDNLADNDESVSCIHKNGLRFPIVHTRFFIKWRYSST